jgi:hypothetical protein
MHSFIPQRSRSARLRTRAMAVASQRSVDRDVAVPNAVVIACVGTALATACSVSTQESIQSERSGFATQDSLRCTAFCVVAMAACHDSQSSALGLLANSTPVGRRAEHIAVQSKSGTCSSSAEATEDRARNTASTWALAEGANDTKPERCRRPSGMWFSTSRSTAARDTIGCRLAPKPVLSARNSETREGDMETSS